MYRDRPEVFISAACVVKPGPGGKLEESQLLRDKRSRKVGVLPEKARMVLAAASRCVPEALTALPAPTGDSGVSLGTLHGSMDAAEMCLRAAHAEGFGKVVPSWYATGLPNATAAILAAVHNLGGPNLTFLGHKAGIDAIINGCRQITVRRAGAMLVGGFDLPGPFFAEELATRYGYASAAVIHPGAGLLWLSEKPAVGPALARIAGWSQGFHPDADGSSDEWIGRIVDDAADRNHISVERSAIHVVYPRRNSDIDYLAATAPIGLIEDIVESAEPGFHAIVSKGYGPEVSCLVIEKGPQ
jgi:3-oxoacyl-[acyl-carrier-protein] synthase II